NPIIIENFPGEAPIWAIPSDQMIVLKFYGPNISTDLTDITFRGIIFDGTTGVNPTPNYESGLAVTGGFRFFEMGCWDSGSGFDDGLGCSKRLVFENNEMRNTAAAIAISGPGAGDQIWRNNWIHHIGKVQAGVFYMQSRNNIWEGNRFENIVGLTLLLKSVNGNPN